MVFVSAGEMAVQRVDGEPVKRASLLGPESKAVHARIDHHIAWPARRDFLPSSDLIEAVEDRPGSSVGRGGCIVRPDAVKDHQADPARERPKRRRLRPARHEKIAATASKSASAVSRAPNP